MCEFVYKAQKFWEYGSGRTTIAAFCAHSASISIGICQGYSAILIPQLTVSENFHIGPEEASWLASLGAITNPIGSILSGILAEYFGRKRSIQMSSFPFIIGWICIAIATDIPLLYTGRLISGIAAGMSSASYTYVSEISTAENRGVLQSLGPICASFGILLTYTLGYFFTWHTIALISLIFAILTIATVQFLPESPEHLANIGQFSASFDSYLWFRRSNAIAQNELDRHNPNTKCDSSDQDNVEKEPWLTSTTVKPFLILVALFFLQEMSGIYTILFYAVNFFEEANLKIDNYISSILVGFIRFSMSLVSAYLINKFGRKILCMTSSGGMSLTMLAMMVYVKYYEMYPSETKIFDIFPLVCVIFNVFFSMIGMLPIPWILVGELFPLQVRSIMTGLVICIAQCFIFLCVKVYPDMITFLGFSTTLAIFMVASIGAFMFSKFLLPETKNKSLKEIEEYFQKGKVIKEREGGYDNRGFIGKPEIFTVTVG